MFKLDDHMLIEIAYFVDRQCLPVWRLPRKIMRHDDLTYIYKGKGTYLINDVPYDVKQGDLVYIPSGSIREAYTDSCNPICCYAFNFNCKTIEDENIILRLFGSTFQHKICSKLITSSSWSNFFCQIFA